MVTNRATHIGFAVCLAIVVLASMAGRMYADTLIGEQMQVRGEEIARR